MQMQNDNLKFKNKRVGILGLGEENIAVVEYLIKQNAKVVICDEMRRGELGEYYRKVKDLPVQFRLGPHYLDHLEDFKIIFRTPGLPYFNEKIQVAKKNGVEISSQTKLFFDLCPSPIIGVTGTKGKGTTTSLIGEILKLASGRPSLSGTHPSPVSNSPSAIRDAATSLGVSPRPITRVFVGGNIGNPPIKFIDELTKDDIVVLELSSFQLQDLDRSPHIAVILDIRVDHLDIHKDEAEYVEAKRNIVRYQTKQDFAVINADYLTSIEFASSTPAKIFWFSRRKSVDLGTFVLNDELIMRTEKSEKSVVKISDIQLRGLHNLENICAAIIASYLAIRESAGSGLTRADIESIKKGVKEFKGLEHRLEFVREIDKIKFYNDSFSTTPETTIAAIKSFDEPIILLLGGSEKNADYQELAKTIEQKNIKLIIPIGRTAKRIVPCLGEIKSIEEAVKIAADKAKSGDIVLLSPASASFDRFKNYKERGKLFKKAVQNL